MRFRLFDGVVQLLITYRDTEAPSDPGLPGALAELVASPWCDEIALARSNRPTPGSW